MTKEDYVARNGYLKLYDIFYEEQNLNEPFELKVELGDGYATFFITLTDTYRIREVKEKIGTGTTEYLNGGMTSLYTSVDFVSQEMMDLMNIGQYDSVPKEYYSSSQDFFKIQNGKFVTGFFAPYYQSGVIRYGLDKGEGTESYYDGVDMIRVGNTKIFALAQELGYKILAIKVQSNESQNVEYGHGTKANVKTYHHNSVEETQAGDWIYIDLAELNNAGSQFAYVLFRGTHLYIEAMRFERREGITEPMYTALETNSTINQATGKKQSANFITNELLTEMNVGFYDKVSGALESFKMENGSYVAYMPTSSGSASAVAFGETKGELIESGGNYFYEGVDMITIGNAEIFNAAIQLGYKKLCIKVEGPGASSDVWKVNYGVGNTSKEKISANANALISVIEISLKDVVEYNFAFVQWLGVYLKLHEMYFVG